jgi:hypothetical protein
MAEDWNLVQLPFLRPPSQLPAPLPSEKDFLESPTVFKATNSESAHHRVVAVAAHFVVKHGRGVKEIEGQNMLFLERYANASLTVPRLYAMWRMPSSGHLCLVMERIEGEQLESPWPTLTSEEKSVICAKVKTSIDCLRTIPSPGFFGGVGRTNLPYHGQGSKDVCGPFENNSEFNAALANQSRMKANVYNIDDMVKSSERHLNIWFGGHPPVFTHADLQKNNILINKSGNSMEVALVDWEFAGWSPTFWEYAINFSILDCFREWPEYFKEILTPYHVEADVLRSCFRDLWGF